MKRILAIILFAVSIALFVYTAEYLLNGIIFLILFVIWLLHSFNRRNVHGVELGHGITGEKVINFMLVTGSAMTVIEALEAVVLMRYR